MNIELTELTDIIMRAYLRGYEEGKKEAPKVEYTITNTPLGPWKPDDYMPREPNVLADTDCV